MKTTVKIIDSDARHGRRISMHLQRNGYEVEYVDSIRTEKDIQLNGANILLFDADIVRDDLSDTIEYILRKHHKIPVVLISRKADYEQVLPFFAMGLSDWLKKPLKTSELPLIIERNLYRHKNEKELLQRNKRSMLVKSILILMRALDAKDTPTSDHTRRVARLAALIGRELQLNPEQMQVLLIASILHDIGKIGLPDRILKKPGRLRNWEMNMARFHPVVGSEIIGEIKELEPVAKIIRHHHERFDGDGYPDGLIGYDIPLFARIVAILDAYEAMVTERNYCKAKSRQDALEEIIANAGKQFDPYLVYVFATIMKIEESECVEPVEIAELFSNDPEDEEPDDSAASDFSLKMKYC